MENVTVLNGNMGKALLRLAIPLFFLNLLNSLYGVVDTYFVGKIGELAVGSISLVTPIMWCALSVAMGLSAGATAIISSYFGANDKEKVNQYASLILYITFVFALLFTIITFVFSKQILMYLKAPEEIYDNAYDYLRIVAFDFFGLFMMNIYMAIRQACGDSKSGVIVSSIASILNVILDPIFIYGAHLGVAGAAIATVLSKICILPIIFASLLKDHNGIQISFTKYKINLQDILHILKLSIPGAFGQFLEALGFVLLNRYIVSYGAIAITAYGISDKMTTLYNIPIMSFSNVLPTFIGQNLGANQIDRAKKSYRTTLWITVLLSIVLMILGTWIMRSFILAFVPNASESLIYTSSKFIFLNLIMGPFTIWYFNLCGVFNGAGHTNISFFLSILRLWGTRLPMVYLFTKYTTWGLDGILIAMLVSNFLVGSLAQILYAVYPWTKSKAIR